MLLNTKNRMSDFHGFSLMEMMAVLVLIGLISSVVVPNFNKWFESTEDQVSAAKILTEVQNLLIRAALLEQDFLLNEESYKESLADKRPALILPDGWKISDNQFLNVWRSGLCEDSILSFEKKDKIINLEIKKKSCLVFLRK